MTAAGALFDPPVRQVVAKVLGGQLQSPLGPLATADNFLADLMRCGYRVVRDSAGQIERARFARVGTPLPTSWGQELDQRFVSYLPDPEPDPDIYGDYRIEPITAVRRYEFAAVLDLVDADAGRFRLTMPRVELRPDPGAYGGPVLTLMFEHPPARGVQLRMQRP